MAAMSSSNLLANRVSDQWNSNQAAALKFDSNFDLSDKTFSAIFQNISPCKYTDVKSNCLNDNNNALILLHLNIRSLQKNFDDLCEFITMDLLRNLMLFVLAKLKLKIALAL